ncbi:MAG: lipopolysaccharide transport periplasmic protein LptA [Parvibaculum sp.]
MASFQLPVAAEEGKGLVGFRADPDAPIEIEADTLEVQQNAQQATFIGNVDAIQGTMRLRSDKLVVFYAEKTAASSGGEGGTEITRIRADGNVHVMSEDDQSADGQWAIYQVVNSEITMGDAVVLRQGDNVVRGNRLKIDLNTGVARVESAATAGTPDTESGSNGRVRGLFKVPQQ